jgi:hypothetical protein
MPLIKANNGYGQYPNPFEQNIYFGSSSIVSLDWKKWEAENPKKLIIDQDGNDYLETGEVEAELRWQFELDGEWKQPLTGDYSNYLKKEKRQVWQITGKEEKETKPIETVEEAAYSYACDKYTVACEEFDLAKSDFEAGAKHILSQTNLISRDKVIETIGNYYNSLHSWQDADVKQILIVIKAL